MTSLLFSTSQFFFGFTFVFCFFWFRIIRLNDSRCINLRYSKIFPFSLLRRFYESLIFFFWKKVLDSVFKKEENCPEKSLGVVKIYILLGQSNMLGMGHISGDKDGSLEYAVKKKGLYSYLIDCEGKWVASDCIRNVRVMDGKDGKMDVYHNEFMTIRGDTIGPEVGISHVLEKNSNSPIMLLKSCIGNRSLGWDLLPPGSKQYEYKGQIYAGYKESPAKWPKGNAPEPPKPGDWYAGKQYDDDISNVKKVLSDLDRYYPDAQEYEISGFFWWQGDKDRYDEGYAAVYERNLFRLIGQLRKEFNAPDAKFVLSTLGQTEIGTANGNEKLILDAMLGVDGNSGKYPEFLGNVSTVYTHPLSKGGASNNHYGGNAETYMNVGEAMGKAMVELTPQNCCKVNENEIV